jgi:CRP-like cAMP-binding protein
LKHVLYKARAPIDYVYFPTSGVCSAIATTVEGHGIEVATVGDEGMVGLPAILGNANAFNEVVMQVPGAALRMPVKQLEKERAAESRLFKLLVLYHYFVLAQASQSVACNALHNVRQRCSRWLLMTHDRVHSGQLHLTHEYLAIMLGVRRSSVTEVLKPLQEKGLLTSRRGIITILNRAGLEKQSCECYGVIRDEYRRLLGDEPGR